MGAPLLALFEKWLPPRLPSGIFDHCRAVYRNNCGSVWAQTFSYDAFGNVTKSGSISWQPGYSSSTNRYTLGGTSYDANGNVLKDSFNTYTWDAESNLASANAGTATYDAFGRMVENYSGSNQFVYSPVGQQPLAVMQGQVLSLAYLPLPAGAVAVYNGSGLLQYNHADWLGSARLFSNPSRVAIPAMAYAPFGEGYAGGTEWIQFTGAGNAWTVADSENQSGSLEDFLFRRYSPVQGRWISPDPAGTAAVDPTNPQSWNRYAYVLNNPLAFVDPLGLDLCSSPEIEQCPPPPPLGGNQCYDPTTGGNGSCPIGVPPQQTGNCTGPSCGGGGSGRPANNGTPQQTARQKCLSQEYGDRRE